MSIAYQKNWGEKKVSILEKLLDKFIVADINVEQIINRYAEIDAFSQGKLLERKLNVSSRNMGKNDLWIAATASILKIKLLTTDRDFLHLKDEYLDLELITLK